jgi:hypothetical protein
LFNSPQLNQLAIISSAITAARLGLPVAFGSFAADVRHQLAVCRRFATFDIFIDGFKSVSRYCALKAARFPVRGVIHMLRDPRSFAASSKRKQVPVQDAARQWSSMHATISRVTRLMGERVIEIRYEELCATPNEELARFNSVAVGREMRMVELKKEINELAAKAGEQPRYKVEFEKT